MNKDKMYKCINEKGLNHAHTIAATEAMNRGKINYKYVLGILQNWKAKGRDIKTNNKAQEVNPMKFNNFKAREYDYDDLEKKLLGWDKDDTDNMAQ